MVSHQTHAVEHPELIARRFHHLARAVRNESVNARMNCGFAQFRDSIHVHPREQWAKLQATVGGARLASDA